jgi:aminopeptidase N
MRRSLLVAVSTLGTALMSTALLGTTLPGTAGAGSATAATPSPAPAPAPAYGAARSTPREDPYYPAQGDPSVDALHYGLALRWAPRTRTLAGSARITFRSPVAQSRVRLDLGRPLRVRRVALDGRRVRFAHPGKDLVVATGALAAGSRHRLDVSYRGHPRSVAAPTHRGDIPHLGWTTTRRGEVWTMQEPFGAYTWYPVNDQPADKAFYDVRISVPRGMVGISGGRLVSRRTSAGRTVTRWHLASPASSYLTTIAIGDYVRHTDRGPHRLPISYWLPRRNQKALPELRRTPAMIRWLESKLGRYPFDRIGAVVVPSDSAMETQTLVTMGGRLMFDRRTFRADLLHEYAHQWYGDTVTPDNWTDLWLNESFAMYTQIRWEVARGYATMAQWRRLLTEEDQRLRASDGPPGAYHRREFGELCVYYCGALMLDRLRAQLGDQLFGAVWRGWPQQHRFASVDRADYLAWLTARTGRDLGPFVSRWLTSPTTPS